MMEKVSEPLKRFHEKRGTAVTIATFIFVYLILMTILTLVTNITFLSHTKIVIVRASTYILISVGLTMTTRVRKFGNFAQAEFVTFGLYIAVAINLGNYSGWTRFMGAIFGPTIFAQMIAAFIFTGLLGVLGEIVIFGPLIRKKATRLSLMTASIGFGIIIRQVLQEMFSAVLRKNEPLYPGFFDTIGDTFIGKIPFIGWLFVKSTTLNLGSLFNHKFVIITQNDMWSIIVMLITVYTLNVIFKKTTLGISMRATSDDADLAQITGINTNRVNYWTWFIAGGVTGMGALFRFTESSFQPASGFLLLLVIFAVVVLGGFDSFEGTLVAGFIVALVESYTDILNTNVFAKLNTSNSFFDAIIFWDPVADWTKVIPFIIIIAVLIWRPRGLMGVVDPKSKL
ncbi:MAG: branched-chain amino acid ABC transporter permease [Candidatus Heimdallarchaeota archaeon]|nr:branched-chain amino acid ABC transporter permease [Candidatus Heimdallarchaeota archaeon]